MSQLAGVAVHVPAPAGERSKTTDARPEPPSAELLASRIVARTRAPLAGEVIEPVGLVRSIDQLKVAGVASVFAAASVARTWKLCAPSASEP